MTIFSFGMQTLLYVLSAKPMIYSQFLCSSLKWPHHFFESSRVILAPAAAGLDWFFGVMARTIHGSHQPQTGSDAKVDSFAPRRGGSSPDLQSDMPPVISNNAWISTAESNGIWLGFFLFPKEG